MNEKVKPFSSVVIIGFGDIGQRVATIWREKGLNVRGLARSDDSKQQMQARQVEVIQADLAQPDTLRGLNLANSLVYYFAPPPRRGLSDPHVQHLLAAIDPDKLPARIVAISTSGVYGDCQGELVNEERPTHPQADRAHRRLDMEQQLRQWGKQHQVPVVILRVGGIYSCERLPLERIRKAIPLVHEHLAPRTNRIHADDLAQVCVAAALKGKPDNIYNVSDGCDSNMTEYFLTLADYFDLPRPPLVDWQQAQQSINPAMLSYLRESRRMDNSKMLSELEVTLKYPDLLSGIRNCKERSG
ncbi:MAG: SDR family oxidoreductase [Thioalkalispiraceae bacterium]|jgi:nucleoside-diphosphate-sugar epimerase